MQSFTFVHKNQHFVTIIFLAGKTCNGNKLKNVIFVFNSLLSCGIANEYAHEFMAALMKQTGIDLKEDDFQFFDVIDMPR